MMSRQSPTLGPEAASRPQGLALSVIRSDDKVEHTRAEALRLVVADQTSASGTADSKVESAERAVLEDLVDRIFPPDELGPGGRELGAAEYIMRWAAKRRADRVPQLIEGLSELAKISLQTLGSRFVDLEPRRQVRLIERVLGGEFEDHAPMCEFINCLITLTVQGVFGDPSHGGNRDGKAWDMMDYPQRPKTAALTGK